MPDAATREPAQDRGPARPHARDRAVPRAAPRLVARRRGGAVRRAARAAAARPRPALHVRPATVRPGRPDRRRGRRGRSHLDHDGRSLLPPACASAVRRRSRSRCDRPSCSRRPDLPEAPALASAVAQAARRARSRHGRRRATRSRPRKPGRPAEHLETLRRAAREHERLTIEYFAGSTGEWSTRDIEPEEVFSAMGNWYVAAWDVGADDERLFRADRIRAVASPGSTFEPRGLEGAGRALYTPTGEEVARADRAATRSALDRRVLRDRATRSSATTDRWRSRCRRLGSAGWPGSCCGSAPTPRCCAPPEAVDGRRPTSPATRSPATAEPRARRRSERRSTLAELPVAPMARVG